MKVKLVLSMLLISLLSINVKAQRSNDDLQRVEFEVKASDEYKVVPVGSSGIILFYKTSEKGDERSSRVWVFTKYNTNFKEEWEKEISIRDDVDLANFVFDDRYLYLLFHDRDWTKSNYKLIRMEAGLGATTEISGNALNFKDIDMCSMNKAVCFGGTSVPNQYVAMLKAYLALCTCYIPYCLGMNPNNTDPIVYYSDFDDDEADLKPINIKGGSKISDITFDEYSKTSNIVIINKYKKINHTYVYEMNADGDYVDDYDIVSKGGNVLTSGKVNTLGEDEKIMIGTYVKPLKNSNFVGKFMNNTMFRSYVAPVEYANGLYISKLEDNRQQYIKYYGFENFDELMVTVNSRREAKKIKKKIQKKKAKGKDVNIGYRLLVHDIVKQNNEYVMVAEAYYPEYHYETRTVYVNGKATTQSVRVFDGYRYTHAIVAGFNTDGEMVWDHTFPIQDILTFNLKERVKVLVHDAEVVLAYSHGGFIKSKVISRGEVVEGKRSTKIEYDRKYKKSKAEYESELDYWYDNYFLASGFQKLVKKKNERSRGEKKKSLVFYFSKIAFE